MCGAFLITVVLSDSEGDTTLISSPTTFSLESKMMFTASDDNPEDYINYVGENAVSIDIGERGKEMIDVLKLNERFLIKVYLS